MYHIQTSLFYDLQELIRNSSLLRKYYYLFQALDLSILPDRNYGVGRIGHSQHAILRALIIKHLECIKSIPQLIEYLESFPALLELCGFTLGDIPDESQFYRFMTDTNNTIIKNIHHQLNHRLIEQGLVSLDTLIIDSKPVMDATK
jgi:transposase